MLQTNDTNPAATVTTRLLVAMEMSLKTWRLVMVPEGGIRKRVKTIEAGNFPELEQAVVDARERFKLPAQTPLVFCYSEIFGWRQFRNRREVGAVLGLTPTPYSSGQDEREQGISKAGNRRARSILVELSWLWLRYQPATRR